MHGMQARAACHRTEYPLQLSVRNDASILALHPAPHYVTTGELAGGTTLPHSQHEPLCATSMGRSQGLVHVALGGQNHLYPHFATPCEFESQEIKLI